MPNFSLGNKNKPQNPASPKVADIQKERKRRKLQLNDISGMYSEEDAVAFLTNIGTFYQPMAAKFHGAQVKASTFLELDKSQLKTLGITSAIARSVIVAEISFLRVCLLDPEYTPGPVEYFWTTKDVENFGAVFLAQKYPWMDKNLFESKSKEFSLRGSSLLALTVVDLAEMAIASDKAQYGQILSQFKELKQLEEDHKLFTEEYQVEYENVLKHCMKTLDVHENFPRAFSKLLIHQNIGYTELLGINPATLQSAGIPKILAISIVQSLQEQETDLSRFLHISLASAGLGTYVDNIVAIFQAKKITLESLATIDKKQLISMGLLDGFNNCIIRARQCSIEELRNYLEPILEFSDLLSTSNAKKMEFGLVKSGVFRLHDLKKMSEETIKTVKISEDLQDAIVFYLYQVERQKGKKVASPRQARMKNCRFCSYANYESANWCENCGKEFGKEKVVVELEAEPVINAVKEQSSPNVHKSPVLPAVASEPKVPPAVAPKPAAGANWKCSRCTLENDGMALICGACGANKPVQVAVVVDKWACAACTLQNAASAKNCAVCGNPKA